MQKQQVQLQMQGKASSFGNYHGGRSNQFMSKYHGHASDGGGHYINNRNSHRMNKYRGGGNNAQARQ